MKLVFFYLFLPLPMYTPRSEFPGLKASPNWVLSDAAGGTQVDLNHSQDLSGLRAYQAT